MMSGEKITVKEKTLAMLENSRGIPVSGEMLAKDIGVSRAAIWKAIEVLRGEGYPISAAPNKGYILAESSDLLSAQGILPYLDREKHPEIAGKIHVFKEIESTNKTAKQLALEGAEDGTVVLAEAQTKGRGRLGRSFFSPAFKGLYLSFVIRPDFNASKALLVTTAASVAVCRAISDVCGVQGQIKWVNDIYVGGKKICGILTEALSNFENGQIDAIIIGIGINCSMKTEDFPEELQETAGSLSVRISRNQLAASVIKHMADVIGRLCEGPYPEYMDEYRRRSIVLRKDILVYQNVSTAEKSEGLQAKAVDITDEGGLMVIYEDGTKDTLTTGEITIRVRDGAPV